MHRSSFRVLKQPVRLEQPTTTRVPPPSDELKAIRDEIGSLCAKLSPIQGTLDSLKARKDDVTVPADIAKSLQLVHGRLDRLEAHEKAADERAQKAITTFSNAILKLSDKVEKISGGEDSKFSLAHSLEKLIEILMTRSMRIIRNDDGDMIAVEPKFENKQ